MEKILIIKSQRPDYWYASLVGETFEVAKYLGINSIQVKRPEYPNAFFSVHSMDVKTVTL